VIGFLINEQSNSDLLLGFIFVSLPFEFFQQIYLECLPLFARGLVRLPNHQRLLRELRLLERHTHRSGRDTVDHGRNGHDDHANAVCGVLRKMSNHLGYDLFNGCVD
jgi:hypothetical protein